MHARVIHADITDLAEAERGLNEEVIPRMVLPDFPWVVNAR
jgi:hypothetical protein